MSEAFLFQLLDKGRYTFKYQVSCTDLLTNQNSIQEEIKCRLKAGNSVQEEIKCRLKAGNSVQEEMKCRLTLTY